MLPPDYWAQHYQTNHTKIHGLDHFLFAKDLTNPGLKQAWQLKTSIVYVFSLLFGFKNQMMGLIILYGWDWEAKLMSAC